MTGKWYFEAGFCTNSISWGQHFLLISETEFTESVLDILSYPRV